MRLVGAALVAGTLAIAGCGGDDGDETGTGAEDGNGTTATTASQEGDATTTTAEPTESGGEAIDVCTLVSEEDVSEVAGVAVTSQSLDDASGAYGVCEWGVEAEGFYRVRMTVGPADLYELLRSNAGTDLAGLGDEAWSYQYGTNGDMLDIGVLAGGYNVLVFFDPIDDPAVGQALVQQVLDALGV